MICFNDDGFPRAQFSPLQPLGHNTVSRILKETGVKTGLNVSGQGYCQLFVTSLVNNPAVSVEESLGAARHGSVSAQKAYIMRNSTSEASRMKALLKKSSEF